MPGITQAYPDSNLPTIRKPSRDTDNQLPSFDPSPTVPLISPSYPFMMTTTAYGLNEPQWSIGGPPPLKYAKSPYACVPLPPLPLIDIHKFLLCREPKVTPITWPVHLPPGASARLESTSAHKDKYHWKTLPALSHDPHSHSSLMIRVASTSFTRPIIVVPADNKGVITIGDVLNCVYSGLRQCANDVLCESMQISPSLLSEQLFRMHGFPQTKTAVRSMGQKQLNDEVSSHIAQILEFKTQWDGLTPSNRERGVLILRTKALAPRRPEMNSFRIPSFRSPAPRARRKTYAQVP